MQVCPAIIVIFAELIITFILNHFSQCTNHEHYIKFARLSERRVPHSFLRISDYKYIRTRESQKFHSKLSFRRSYKFARYI